MTSHYGNTSITSSVQTRPIIDSSDDFLLLGVSLIQNKKNSLEYLTIPNLSTAPTKNLVIYYI